MYMFTCIPILKKKKKFKSNDKEIKYQQLCIHVISHNGYTYDVGVKHCHISSITRSFVYLIKNKVINGEYRNRTEMTEQIQEHFTDI